MYSVTQLGYLLKEIEGGEAVETGEKRKKRRERISSSKTRKEGLKKVHFGTRHRRFLLTAGKMIIWIK